MAGSLVRPQFDWDIGTRVLRLGERTLVMGVVNVTPDSFFDGGKWFDRDAAVDHALRLLDEGADIVDVGGESTRPGAHVLTAENAQVRDQAHTGGGQVVGEDEELRRVVPVLSRIKQLRPQAVVSLDTYKAAVARAGVEAGAEIVNDVSGGQWDAKMMPTLAPLTCGVVLTHVRGRPSQWRSLPPLCGPGNDVIELVTRELREYAAAAVQTGVVRSRLVLDPGFGFGKRYEENYPLLARFQELHALGLPLLAGLSRKSFIGRAVYRGKGTAPVSERLFGSIAAAAVAVSKGAHIIRTHDVKETCEAAAVVDTVLFGPHASAGDCA